MISLKQAAAQIKNKQIVAYPTESFYALGADATNPAAIRKLFRLKKRESSKPIALIAADIGQVQNFFYVSSSEMTMAKKYWPGALTMLLQPKVPAGKTVGEIDERYIATQTLGVKRSHTTPRDQGVITGILNTITSGQLPRPILIGVRVPGHAGARQLAKLAEAPITATSANISGRRPTKNENTIKRIFPGTPIMLGRCGKQTKPSTILEVQEPDLRVHRTGAVKIS